MKKLLILTFFHLSIVPVKSQVMVKIGTIHPCLDTDSVTVPVFISGFTNVGAVTLKINYNTSHLTYAKAMNWHPAFSGMIWGNQASTGTFGCAWTMNNLSVNISSAKLVDLRFKYHGGYSPIQFSTAPDANEIADSTATPIPTQFINGAIESGQPDTSLLLLGSASLCSGDSVTLQADTNAIGWQWLKNGIPLLNQQLNSLSVNATGLYSVILQSVWNCLDTSQGKSIQVHPLPQPNLGNDTLICDTSSILLQPNAFGIKYHWSTGDSTFQVILDSTHLNLGQNVVWVQVTDSNGCIGTDSLIIHCIHCSGIPTIIDEFPQFYPNPVKNGESLLFSGFNTPLNIEILSDDGRILVQKEIAFSPVKISIPETKPGFYFILIRTKRNMLIRKLLIIQ